MPALTNSTHRQHPYPPGADDPIGPLDRWIAAAGLGVAGTAAILGAAGELGVPTGSSIEILAIFAAVAGACGGIGEVLRR